MTEVGNVYGGALYDLAAAENLSREILEELSVLEKSFAEMPDFIRLLASPNLPKQERCRILDDSFSGKVHQYVLNFLKILTEKGYPRYFSDCCASYREHYNQDHGILPVTAVTATPLTEDQSARLTEKLNGITGKSVQLTNKVDSACLGGVRLDFDGKRLDDTVAHRLEAVRSLLKNTVL